MLYVFLFMEISKRNRGTDRIILNCCNRAVSELSIEVHCKHNVILIYYFTLVLI